MKYYKLLLLVTFLTVNLNAEYLRTIRIGSLTSEAKTKWEINKLNKYIQKQNNIVALQKRWKFDFKYRKSGKYYIIVAEPFRDKVVVQSVLDTLRKKYPDAYAARMKVIPKKTVPQVKKIIEEVVLEKKIVPIEIEVEEEVVVETVLEKEIVVKEENTELVIEEVQKAQKELIIKEKEIVVLEKPNQIFKKVESSKEETNTWKYISIVFLLLFLSTLFLLLRSKKKNNKHITQAENIKMQNDEKCVQFSSQLESNENFLSGAQASVSSIISYTNLLLEFDLSVVQKDYVKRIKSSSESLLNTVNNSSDISRIKIGELRIRNLDFNIYNMIQDISNIISLEAKQNNINFTINFAEEIPSHVIGDIDHLRQVLVSLLTNSVKYTRDGDVTLSVKKVYSYSHAITLGFIVSDTGVGMSSDQVESIMNKDGLHPSTNLSVSKQLVEMMNGDMKIYSTQDVGTTFTFNIKFDLKQ